LESGKNMEKSHIEGKNVGRDRILEQPLEDSPPWQHSPLTNHYRTHIRHPIYNERIKTIPPTFDTEVVGMKSCSLSDILHILKELEYTLPIISHSKE
jgi:hypothetical protein